MLMYFPPYKAMIMAHFSVSMFVQFVITFTLLTPTIIIIIYTQTYEITSSITTAMTTLSHWPSKYQNENNHRTHANNNALDIRLGCCYHNHHNHMIEMAKVHFGRMARKKWSKQKQESSSSDSFDTRMERHILTEEQDLLCQ